MTSKILENFLKELSVKALKYGYLDCEKEAKDFLNKHKETINFTGCCEELVCERCVGTKETEIICMACIEELR